MNNNLVIVEDFLPDPEAFRNEIVRLPFYDIWFEGATYKRIHVRSTEEHRPLLEKVVGREIKQAYSFIRLNYTGEFPHNAVHCDSTCGAYAAILYLNRPEQCKGGTALWRHRETGHEFLPTDAEIKKVGKSPVRVRGKLISEWDMPDKWEQVAKADMKFNRLAIYPASCFHSRYPFEAFGSTPEDGRLTWVTFFECNTK